jgi:hypothetical protein
MDGALPSLRRPPPRRRIEGAHEKGGVEGQIGWCRRDHMVPVPEVVSLAQLNAMIERWDAEDERRRIGTRPRPVSEYSAVERPLLQPLPDEFFATGRLFSLRGDRFNQISVRTNRYSVPVRLIGRTVRAMLRVGAGGLRRPAGGRPPRTADRQGQGPA